MYYDGKLAKVVEFLAQSDSPSDRAKLHRCKGLCFTVVIEAEEKPIKKCNREQTKEQTKSNNSLTTLNTKPHSTTNL